MIDILISKRENVLNFWITSQFQLFTLYISIPDCILHTEIYILFINDLKLFKLLVNHQIKNNVISVL